MSTWCCCAACRACSTHSVIDEVRVYGIQFDSKMRANCGLVCQRNIPCTVLCLNSGARWSKLSPLSDPPHIAMIGLSNDESAAPSDWAEVDLPSSYHVTQLISFIGCMRCLRGFIVLIAFFISSSDTCHQRNCLTTSNVRAQFFSLCFPTKCVVDKSYC